MDFDLTVQVASLVGEEKILGNQTGWQVVHWPEGGIAWQHFKLPLLVGCCLWPLGKIRFVSRIN
jgi:hypothetical protein